MRIRRPALVIAAAAALTIVAAPALAHTTANPNTTAAGSFAVIDFRVPHGCDGAATERLDVQVPAGVVSVKPEYLPGWTATTEIGEFDEPVEVHGEEVTEGVVSVTWTADEGEELPDEQFRNFGMSVKFPDAAGETLYFPAVQTCVDGEEAAWIEIPSSEDEELDSPAPAITLTAGEDGHGHGSDKDGHGGDEDATDEDASGDETDEAAAASADDDETIELTSAETAAGDAGTDPLVWVALVVGGLGLAAGVAGFTAARRR